MPPQSAQPARKKKDGVQIALTKFGASSLARSLNPTYKMRDVNLQIAAEGHAGRF
jgi:hypothetical protein